MKLNQLIKYAPQMIRSGKTFHFRSAPGRGKSTVIKKIAKLYLEGVCCTAMLPNYGPMDIPGYIIPERDYLDRPVALHTMPAWAKVGDGWAFDHDKGMLFIDEFQQGELDVQKSAAPLVLDHEAGHHKLPDGWVVWMASNRALDRSGVSRSLDHIINRTVEIQIEDDAESLVEWMVEENYNELFRAYVVRREQRVFMPAPKDQGPWTTPRSFIAACDILSEFSTDGGLTFQIDPVVQELISGAVGEGTAADMLAFIELRHELPDMKDILAKPGSAKVPGTLDAMMIVTQMLSVAITTENADAIITYVRRMPEDLGVVFCKGAVRKMPTLLKTKAFTKWTADNHSIIAAIAALPSN